MTDPFITRALIVLEATKAGAKQVVRNPGFKGSNFMSPRVVGYYALGDFHTELSEGEFMGSKLIGLTVLPDRQGSLSKCCHSLEELGEALAALREAGEA
jgi:hypothetical protein